MLADQVNELVIGRTDGNGVLYYTAHLRAFLPVPEIERPPEIPAPATSSCSTSAS